MNELTLHSTSQVLTLSANFKPPEGGIAQLVETYSEMYPVFNHIATTTGGSSTKKLITLILALVKFFYWCLFKNISVVHVHGSSNNSFRRKKIFIYLAKIFRKKVVYHVHGGEYKDFYESNPKSIRSLFKRVDVTVALSEFWKAFFEQEIGHQNVKVIENVVPRPVHRAVEKDDRVHFLFLGKLGHAKGVYDLLDTIFDNLNFLKGSAVFHIGGNGEVEEVKCRISELGLEEVVVFEGWVSGSKKINLFNLADVYILPSYNEGLPISILEAMSYRLPVISTPVGGIPEVVVESDNGFLVEPGDSKAMGKAIKRMIEEREFRVVAGQSSYLKVEPHFPEAVSAKLELIYCQML